MLVHGVSSQSKPAPDVETLHTFQIPSNFSVPFAVCIDIAELDLLASCFRSFCADQALEQLEERIRSQFGSSCGLIGRRSGAFAAAIHINVNAEHCDVAELVLRNFRTPLTIDGSTYAPSGAIGAAVGAPGESIETVLQHAFLAMRKAAIRNAHEVVLYDESMLAHTQRHLRLVNDLARAVRDNQLLALFQPIVNISTRSIVGCEALLRWQHPTLGLLGPSVIIPLAEETKCLDAVDTWMLRETCRCLGTLHGKGHRQFFANVNVDEHQLCDAAFHDTLTSLLSAHDIAPRRLGLEITEQIFRNRSDPAFSNLLARLKANHIRLVCDDFGTGYSSLGTIATAPFDSLKLDRSLIEQIDRAPRRQLVLRSILHLARDLDLDVTAEGVESEDEARFLRNNDCRNAQGFLYSRPVPWEHVFD